MNHTIPFSVLSFYPLVLAAISAYAIYANDRLAFVLLLLAATFSWFSSLLASYQYTDILQKGGNNQQLPMVYIPFGADDEDPEESKPEAKPFSEFYYGSNN